MDLARLLAPVAPALCSACGAHAGRSEPLCGECRRALRWLTAPGDLPGGAAVWAPLAYTGPARALVAALKFRGAVALAATMAAQLAAHAPDGWLERCVLVPVPLTSRRRRRRGFNQAELLAGALAERTGLGISDCLERVGRGAPQVGRGRTDRARAIEGTVSVRPDRLIPARAVLVDDVATTGATLAACVKALRAAGVGSIRAVAYARTPGR